MDTAWGLVNAINGKTGQTLETIRALENASKKRYVPATYFGMLYAVLDDKAKALKCLEKAYEERADGLTWLNVLPTLDGLRSSARFKDLLRRVRLVQ